SLSERREKILRGQTSGDFFFASGRSKTVALKRFSILAFSAENAIMMKKRSKKKEREIESNDLHRWLSQRKSGTGRLRDGTSVYRYQGRVPQKRVVRRI